MPSMPPTDMPSRLDQFFAAVGNAAQRLGLQHLVIAARDSATGEFRLVASPGAMEGLRTPIAEKFGFAENEAETSWPA